MRLTIEKFYGVYPTLPAAFLLQLDRMFKQVKENKVEVTVVSMTYTIVKTDDVVVYTGTGGHTFYLPHATPYNGYTFAVKHAGAGNLTLDATGRGQILTSLGLSNTVTLSAGDGLTLSAGNNNWNLI